MRTREVDVPPHAEARKSQCASVNRLAELTGMDRRTVKRALAGLKPAQQRKGSPVYALDAAVEVLREHAAKRTALEPAKERRIELQNEKLEEEIAILKGAHTSNDVIEAFLVALLSSQNAILMQKECEMPARLAGLDVPTIRERLKKEFDEIRLRIQQAIRTRRVENSERFEK